MAGETKVEFDILANDKASSKLDKVARAFKNVGDEANDVDKNTDGIDRLSKKFEKAGDDSGKNFGGSLKKWFRGDGQGVFTELGKSGGTVFGSGLLGALKTPILGPALVGVVGGAVAVAMPAIGAIAGGALVSGFGAGIAGLGIVFAAKSEVVKSVWSKSLADMGSQMQLLSKPFEKTLISMAGVASRTFAKFAPALGAAFSTMAPVVDRFVDSAARSLEQLIPAIGPISDAFGDVLDSLGPALQSAVGNLADGMTELALSVSKNPDGLADLVRGVGELVGSSLNLIRILNDVNGSFEELTGGMSLVDVTIGILMGPIIVLSSTFSLLGKGIDLVNAALGRSGKDADGAGAAMSAAANQTGEMAAALGKTGEGAKNAAAPLQTVTDALSRQKLQFSGAIAAMGQWTSNAISASSAAIGYEASLDAATEAVKENGKTLDIGTEKGRANRTALNQIAEAANKQTQAMDDAGASNVATAATAEKSKANFIKLAIQMGATKAQAKVMADAMINIPNVSREAKLTANKRDLETKLAAAKRELANPNLTKERKAQLNADIKKLQAGIATAKAALAGVPKSKTVTITTRLVTERISRTVSGASGGHVPTERRAAGGPVKKGQPYIVGEEGPEWLIPDQNGTILPNGAKSARGMAAAAGGSPGRVVLEFRSDGSPHMDYLMREVRKYVKIVGGGSVQQAFGTTR